MEERLDALVSAEMTEQLLAVLREALSNVTRHADASRVSVAVTVGSDLILTVRDDGSGMKGSTRRSGLANLADRAGKLGGTLRVGPAAAGGTELQWRVPLPQGDQSGG
jgi:signal transduction histidine kinase